jgi:hypothetical protein
MFRLLTPRVPSKRLPGDFGLSTLAGFSSNCSLPGGAGH